jgi:hypothetical protein
MVRYQKGWEKAPAPSGDEPRLHPGMVKLLDEGKIPCRTVGKYRRVRLADLLAYKEKDDAARAKIADQLAAEAQELGMGY